MRTLAAFLLVGVLTMPHLVHGQKSVISGRIIDSETLQPVPFTHIFIVNTSFGATTNEDGSFQFSSDNFGEADLMVSFIGYDSYRKHIVFTGAEIKLGTIRLKPSETQLDEVVVKSSRDAAWEKDLKKFKAIFLGKEGFASQCTIDNPWVIDLKNDEVNHTFTAKSLVPIKITNRALGYQMDFFLRRMVSTPEGYSIEGESYFMPIEATSKKEIDQWARNRELVYRHSLTNLLRSIVNRTVNNQGFSLYSEMGQTGAFTRLSRFTDNLYEKKLRVTDTLALVTTQPGTDKYVISFKGKLEAHYRNERSKTKVYQDLYYAVSWLTLKSNSIVVNAQGIPMNPTAITVSGAMSDDRVASMLPLDYVPASTAAEKQQQVTLVLPSLYEQIYVHTDKPYYYAGEQLWFKGYLNYQTPSYRDSLSRTVYVDLINPESKIVLSKTIRIDSGRFSGEFDLPVGSDAGTYNLRAYTNLQRNFGDSSLYVKLIPLLDLKDFVERVPASTITQDGVTITTAKDKYKSREKIEVQVALTNEEGNPIIGDLSISVTDVKQVSPVHITPNLLEGYPISNVPAIERSGTNHPFVVEYGITINGQFLNNSGKPEKAAINVVQLNPKDLVLAESDDAGFFSVNHLMIYDSARFSITGLDKKGKPYGKAVLNQSTKPEIFYKKLKDGLHIVPTTEVQRDMSHFGKAGDVKVLDEVEIRGNKILEEYTSDFRVRRPYGKPDYALTAKDFAGRAYPNAMMMIQGRFPGLIVKYFPGLIAQPPRQDEPPRWFVFLKRNEYQSLYLPKEVIVTVNNVLMSGTAEQIIMTIDPNTIQSIELKTGTNVLYGNVSNQGILAFYLKDGSEISLAPEKGITTVKATGYNSSPGFSSPNYETEKTTTPDYRSLIFWSPFIPMSSNGTGSVSFYSADLDTTYRIEIEGVTVEGKPIHVVKTIEIAN